MSCCDPGLMVGRARREEGEGEGTGEEFRYEEIFEEEDEEYYR
jgi:hypothetical protein